MIPPIGVKIFGRDTLSSKLSRIQKKLNKFGKSTTRVGRSMTVGLTAPLGLLGYKVLQTAGDFEYGMNRVSAITGATGKDFEMLRQHAKHLGETTTFTAGQVTEGMQMLAQAGLKPIQVYESIGTVLKGAQANMVDMSEAANIGAGLMKTFGYETKDMVKVMDMLTKTSMTSMTNFTELSEAFLYAGPTAGAMGKTLGETASVLGVLANGMIKSSMAGTSLRGMMAKLTAPSSQAIGIMKSLGIQYKDILDQKGNLRSFVDVVKAFETTGITAGQVLQVFGLRAGPGFQVLLNQGSGALQDMMDTIGDFAGTTEKISNVQMAGFRGQMWALTSAFEGFTIAIADSGILVFATELATKFTELFRELSKTHPEWLKFGFIIGLAVAVIGPLLIGLGAVSAALAAISVPVLAVIAVIAILIGWISALVYWWDEVIAFTSKWGWALQFIMGPMGLIIWLGSLLVKNWEKVAKAFKDAYNWLSKLTSLIGSSKAVQIGFGGMGPLMPGEGAKPVDEEQRSYMNRIYNTPELLGMRTPKAKINVNIANAPKGTEVTTESEEIEIEDTQGFAFEGM